MNKINLVRFNDKPEIVFENLGGENIIYRNFKGQKSQFNRLGDKNFNIKFYDKELANELTADGYNVRIKQPDEYEDSVYYALKVNVSYKFGDNRDPKIFTLCNGVRTLLSEEDVANNLDSADIIVADVMIRPYEYVDRDTGENKKSVYLKEAVFTIKADYFTQKYGALNTQDLSTYEIES